MKLEEKLQLLRKKNGYSQEELAEQLGIARQTLSRWENGQAMPELPSLILLSSLYKIPIDRIVKDDGECNLTLIEKAAVEREDLIAFLIRAKRSSYAGGGSPVASSRPSSHDYSYEETPFFYYDTYVGGEAFSGEEAVWADGVPMWTMNYFGRVLGENFSLDFLREALYQVPKEMPYRGPAIYSQGDYHYHCKVDGDFEWYQGYEEVFFRKQKIYECRFQGGEVK